VLQEYGQERLAHEVATQIISARQSQKITKTKMLVEAILLAFRNKLHSHKEVPWVGGVHPATKTFQALRLAVNHELANLQQALPQCLDILGPGGRLAVIAFHSLEDKIVKNFFRTESRDCLCPPDTPLCQCKHTAQIKIITKKVIIPARSETASNPRARSAKLRAAEKI
jgi:16S rRNA (cytosine1402-N4)-methyltransferase